jgi:glycopeptide antibiotics resistance protein
VQNIREGIHVNAMNYFFSSINPGIKPIYFIMAIMIAFITASITRYYRRQKRITKVQAIALIILTTYIFLVFASTVFSRTTRDSYHYKLIPFWSYRRIWQGSKELLWEDIFNGFMLLPVGVFMPMILKENRGAKTFRRVLLMGFLTSFTIELLQLVMKRGLFEFDDMFHNTIGVAIGYGIWWKITLKFNQRKQGV